MSKNSGSRRKIVVGVWGDVVANCTVAHESGSVSVRHGLDRSARVNSSGEYGSAILFARLLDYLSQYKLTEMQMEVFGHKDGDKPREPILGSSNYYKSFSYLKQFEVSNQKDEKWDLVRNVLHEKKLRDRGLAGMAKFPAYIEDPEKPKERRAKKSADFELQIKQEHRKKAWRIKRLLGKESSSFSIEDASDGLNNFAEAIPEDASPEVLVIIDHNLAPEGEATPIRHKPSLWPKCFSGFVGKDPKDPYLKKLKEDAPKKIIYRLSEPIRLEEDALLGSTTSKRAAGADEMKSDLLGILLEHFADRLIIVVSAEALRGSEVFVSSRISWEKMTEDIHWALEHGITIPNLRDAALVVVSFDTAGALLFEGTSGAKGSGHATHVIYDPKGLEGYWLDCHPGNMIGRGYCLTAAIVFEAVRQIHAPRPTAGKKSKSLAMPDGTYSPADIDGFIESLYIGLRTRRDLQLYGYEKEKSKTRKADAKNKHRIVEKIEFRWPVEYVANRLIANFINRHFHLAIDRDNAAKADPVLKALKQNLREPYRKSLAKKDVNSSFHGRTYSQGASNWGLARQKVIDSSPILQRLRIVENNLVLARNIVKKGLDDVPTARFGALRVADRGEVESLRAVRRLMLNYARGKEHTPLSLAVFGSPGSGKSFAVEEIAKDAVASVDGVEITVLTFNLSQFATISQLANAFSLVRDEVIRGKLPVVFWDEFDALNGTTPLGWLKCFLAPMQDGEYFDEGSMHPIGKSIFVFGGGVYENYQSMIDEVRSPAGIREGRNNKAPDFMSRLKGFLDIRSLNLCNNSDGIPLQNLVPNASKCKCPENSGWPLNKSAPTWVLPFIDGSDTEVSGHTVTEELASCLIRRSILLRSFCLKNKDIFREEEGSKELRIDSHVLYAFLMTEEYRHGARSLGALVGMSIMEGKRSFDRSYLPSRRQLDMHVRARDFGRAVHYNNFFERHASENKLLRKSESTLNGLGLFLKHFRIFARPLNVDIESKKFLHLEGLKCLPVASDVENWLPERVGLLIPDLKKSKSFDVCLKKFCEDVSTSGLYFVRRDHD